MLFAEKRAEQHPIMYVLKNYKAQKRDEKAAFAAPSLGEENEEF